MFACLALRLSSETINPQQYMKNSQVQWTWAVLSLDSLEIEGFEEILDIGCGDGKISSLMAERVPSGTVTGVDESKKFIELAQNACQQTNLYFHTGDAQNLCFLEEFDLITAFLCLNWVPELERALNGMYQAAKPGCKALIVIPNSPDPELVKEWRMRFSQDKWQPYIHLFSRQFNRSEEDWKAAILESGWILEKWDIVKTATVFHNRQEMKDWILSLNSGLEQMPEELLEELIDIRLEMITSWYPQAGDGRIYAFPDKINILLSKPI